MIFLLSCVQSSLEFVLRDEHNYSFSSSLSAHSTKIKEGEDATIDWSALQTDLLGTSIEEDPDVLSIIRFRLLSQEEVLLGVNNETLKQSDLSGFVDYLPSEERQADISEFSIQGTNVDPASELLAEQGTFLILVKEKEDIVSLSFFEPDPMSDNHEIIVDDDSVTLSYEVSLQASERLLLEPAREYYIDWSGITQTGMGNPINLDQLDRLVLGGFSLSLAELEGDFLQIEQLAEELYTVDITGENAIPLDRIEGFTSFDDSLLWVVALECSRCMNPAPHFVGVLETSVER